MDRVKKNIQLYAWYPVEGGCPKCNGELVMPTVATQVQGIRDFESTNCPHCGISLEVYIAEKRNGKYEMVELTKLPHASRPKAHVMTARLTDALVISMPTAAKPKTQA